MPLEIGAVVCKLQRENSMYVLGNMVFFAFVCGIIATCMVFIGGYYLVLALLVTGGVLIGMQVSDVLRGE
jgi:hypothetical protein